MFDKSNKAGQFLELTDSKPTTTYQQQSGGFLSLIRRVTYLFFLLFSIVIFIIGILAATNRLPKDYSRTFNYLLGLADFHRPNVVEVITVTKEPSSEPVFSESDPTTSEITQVKTNSLQVKEVQYYLSELGYKPGPIDGLAGKKTYKAIEQFKIDYKVAVSSKDMNDVLIALKQKAPEPQMLPEGYSKLRIVVNRTIELPKNAYFDPKSNDWQCGRGFRKVSSGCLALQLPEKAFLNEAGDDWQCLQGYKKSGNRCVPELVPANAYMTYSGDGWECMRGYRKFENECLEIDGFLVN